MNYYYYYYDHTEQFSANNLAQQAKLMYPEYPTNTHALWLISIITKTNPNMIIKYVTRLTCFFSISPI